MFGSLISRYKITTFVYILFLLFKIFFLKQGKYRQKRNKYHNLLLLGQYYAESYSEQELVNIIVLSESISTF